MAFTHEIGHIIGGWCSGGTLKDASLWPWHLPYSFFDPNPHPLVTLWSGPIVGVMFPVVIAMIFRREWIWLIAYFCILANGVYLATAWLVGEDQLDTQKLLRAGAHPIAIVLYCLLTIGAGYHGLRRSCIRFFTPTDLGHQQESTSPVERGNYR